MSLTTAHEPVVKIASPASISYLVTLLEERSEATIDPATFADLSQADVSDMIDNALTRPALPATEEQLAEVARLAALLGRGTIVTKDMGQASRQIRAMKADLDKRQNGKRTVTPERAATAASRLDAILGVKQEEPVAVAPTASDDIPF